MPVRRRKTNPQAAPNALIASAARIDLKRPARKGFGQADWQAEAWRQYDRSGELRQAAQWMGNSLSRCTIYAADVDDDGAPIGPTQNPRARAAADGMLGTPASAAQILRQIGIHLFVAGECYVIGESPVDEQGAATGDDVWHVASTDELTYQGGKWKLDGGDGVRELDIEHTVLIRIWQSHPRKRAEADSPTRALLPVLAELEQLDQHFSATLDSRLAGAGILVINGQASFPAPSAKAQEDNPGASPLMLSLTEYMMTPLADRSSAASVVPYVIELTAGDIPIDKLIAHIDFAAKITDAWAKAREAAIRRFAIGADMPPEALLGSGGTNHWSAWQIEESGIKLNIEPKLTVIVSALNDEYYVAQLEDLQLDPGLFTLWYSTSELSARPNRGPEAVALHEAGLLKAERAVEESGYSVEDMPGPKERLERLVIELVKAAPQILGPALLPVLGLPATAVADAPQQVPSTRVDEQVDEQDGGTGRELPAAPDDGGSPAQEASLGHSRTLAVHMLATRALELAGKRKRAQNRVNRSELPGDVREYHVHTRVGADELPKLLADAFDQVPEVALMVGLDPGRLQAELHDYVAGLLVAGQPHQVGYLAGLIRKVPAPRAAA